MGRQLFVLDPEQSIRWCAGLGIDLASLARAQRRRRHRRRLLAAFGCALVLGLLALLLAVLRGDIGRVF
jgi:hypothetical protein